METFRAWKRASTVPPQEIEPAKYIQFLVMIYSDCPDLHNINVIGQLVAIFIFTRDEFYVIGNYFMF